MVTKKRVAVVLGLALAGSFAIAACDALNNLGNGVGGVTNGGSQVVNASNSQISDGRKNALRAIDVGGGKKVLVEIRQMTAAPAGQDRCFPYGNVGLAIPAWPVIAQRIFTPFQTPTGGPSEYDWISTLAPDNDVCLSMRIPATAIASDACFFTQVEFSLRSTASHAYGHAPGTPFLSTFGPPAFSQADFPSNDVDINKRSLIDLAGGDVAILVQGLDFLLVPPPPPACAPFSKTNGYMNTLGPNGWVLFMRDNAYRSGRFYYIADSLKGAPPAFFDTGAHIGFFESVQVNGDGFDGDSQPGTEWTAGLKLCPTKSYSFLDRSNITEGGPDPYFAPIPGDGQGGGLLVIRKEAFNGAQVVLNPNVPGALPAAVGPGDLYGPPPSGYDSTNIAPIDIGSRHGLVPGPAGVHEIGWSIFFVHGS